MEIIAVCFLVVFIVFAYTIAAQAVKERRAEFENPGHKATKFAEEPEQYVRVTVLKKIDIIKYKRNPLYGAVNFMLPDGTRMIMMDVALAAYEAMEKNQTGTLVYKKKQGHYLFVRFEADGAPASYDEGGSGKEE